MILILDSILSPQTQEIRNRDERLVRDPEGRRVGFHVRGISRGLNLAIAVLAVLLRVSLF